LTALGLAHLGGFSSNFKSLFFKIGAYATLIVYFILSLASSLYFINAGPMEPIWVVFFQLICLFILLLFYYVFQVAGSHQDSDIFDRYENGDKRADSLLAVSARLPSGPEQSRLNEISDLVRNFNYADILVIDIVIVLKIKELQSAVTRKTSEISPYVLQIINDLGKLAEQRNRESEIAFKDYVR
jgi:hypothetical protein